MGSWVFDKNPWWAALRLFTNQTERALKETENCSAQNLRICQKQTREERLLQTSERKGLLITLLHTAKKKKHFMTWKLCHPPILYWFPSPTSYPQLHILYFNEQGFKVKWATPQSSCLQGCGEIDEILLLEFIYYGRKVEPVRPYGSTCSSYPGTSTTTSGITPRKSPPVSDVEEEYYPMIRRGKPVEYIS